MYLEKQKFSSDENAALTETLNDRLPQHMYCSYDVKRFGLKEIPKVFALERQHIQYNHRNLACRIVYDLDTNVFARLATSSTLLAWEDERLPQPSWSVFNTQPGPSYGHAHICYELEAPVSRTPHSRQKPQQFLEAVKGGLLTTLRTLGFEPDSGFTEYVCKNPWVGLGVRKTQLNLVGGEIKKYSLDELFSYGMPWKKPVKRKPGCTDHFVIKGYGESYRCDLFHDLRLWAYANRRHFADQEQFYLALLGLAENHNRALTEPLKYSTLKSTARSVSRGVWDYFTPTKIAESDARFSALQAQRGTKGGMASGHVRYEKNVDARNLARSMAAQGKNQAEIALILGKNQSTVSRWLRA